MSGKERRTRRGAGADGLAPPDSLSRLHIYGGGSSAVEVLPHVVVAASEI